MQQLRSSTRFAHFGFQLLHCSKAKKRKTFGDKINKFCTFVENISRKSEYFTPFGVDTAVNGSSTAWGCLPILYPPSHQNNSHDDPVGSILQPLDPRESPGTWRKLWRPIKPLDHAGCCVPFNHWTTQDVAPHRDFT